jgi:hypothetical protein
VSSKAPTSHLRHASARTAAFLAFVTAAVLVGAVVGGASARSHTSQLTFKLDHYLCYSIKPTSGFRRKTVLVLDQYRPARKTYALRPELLCNPASKNESKVRNRRGHLLCYTTRVAGTFKTRRVSVTNQFGTVRLDVIRPNSLCLPSGKSIRPSVKAPRPKGLDHFQCYSVKSVTQPEKIAPVSVEDQFGQGRYSVVPEPVRLCNPASKNKSLVVNKRDHLLCYAVDPSQSVEPKDVFVVNQFGRLFATTGAPRQLCVPSLKKTVTS